MANRRAFVMGSNGHSSMQLKYAVSDAKRIKDCLESIRYRFEVISPQEGADTFSVMQKLYNISASCGSEDTFICYFSGHGIIEKGSLFLVWDETDINQLLGTSIPADDIVRALKFCKARNKLLILDCCHAGAAVNMGTKYAVGEPVEEVIKPDNYLVLMASSRLEKAHEIDKLGGSFLTVNICSALVENYDEVEKKDDEKLSVQELVEWLKKKTREYNVKLNNKQVPTPYIFGQERGDFFLTSEESAWVPYEIDWVDGSKMVVLPVKSYFGKVVCIAKHPITNKQYKRFVEETNYKKPSGEHFYKVILGIKKASWIDGFYPWNENDFCSPLKPVVCVSLDDTINYCKWVNKIDKRFGSNTFIPSPELWDLAAFGEENPRRSYSNWLSQTQLIHHNSTSPAGIDSDNERLNKRGVSDMFGNVWEWCVTNSDNDNIYLLAAANWKPDFKTQTLRGGGFLDRVNARKMKS